MGTYEKSHDYAERVTSIVYNMMRNGVPLKIATEHIIESLTKTAEKLHPVDPRFVSSEYSSLEAFRYCEKHFLGTTKEEDVDRKFFLKGIENFGGPPFDEEYDRVNGEEYGEVYEEDMSAFYYDFFIRCSYPRDHSTKRHLAEGDKEGEKQPAKKRAAVENEKGASKRRTGGRP